jgi:Na+-transporting NADH:ubiquinone oxidoreductase subunit NqrB
MLLGLARWPSVHWELARAYPTASPEARVAIDAVFSGLNVYLGNFIGEFLGELSLNAFFLLTAVALLRSGRRWAAYAGFAVGMLGVAGAFRNVTAVVGPVAEVNNYLLPIWLITVGVVLLRSR